MTYLIALIARSWSTAMHSLKIKSIEKENLIDFLLLTSYRQINFKLIDKVIGYFAKSDLTRFNFLIILHLFYIYPNIMKYMVRNI